MSYLEQSQSGLVYDSRTITSNVNQYIYMTA